jgi:aryl-alcohol dehydrogenase-like predicted oxidoreductase
MPVRPLGTTGVEVSVMGLGGSHIGKPKLSTREAIRLMRSALEAGLTFFDNCWSYNDGESEKRMGQALRDGQRDQAFVMTKLDGRSRKEAAKQLGESMRRLQVERIDLLQHHEVIRFEDVDRIFAAGGAMEAFVEAKEQGKIRFIGFTGHKDPAVHLYMLDVARRHGFRFDAVQMPLNVFDTHYRSFEREVLPRLVADGIAVLGMKSLASGVLLKSGKVNALDCLRYALHLPVSVVIAGIDSEPILEQALEAARMKPLTGHEADALRATTADVAANGEYELFKTSSMFDSTARNPKLLGTETERVQMLVHD